MDVRKQLMNIADVFSLKQLIALSSQKIFLPFYHTISDTPLSHISHLYPLRNAQLFEKDLDFFCKHFEPITSTELFALVEENRVPEKPAFHLTFDDGLSEIYTTIAPILEKRGIPATFFVNTDFIDNKNLFYRYKVSLLIDVAQKNEHLAGIILKELNLRPQTNVVNALLALKINDTPFIDHIAKLMDIDFSAYLSEKQPYLTSAQIRDLLKRGFTIGSHSANHPCFKDISFTEQQNQILQSFEQLENTFYVHERYFAFPFTDDGVSADFITWLHENQACKLSFGTAGLKHDFTKYHLQRTGIEGSLVDAHKIVKSEYLYYALKSLLGKNKINRP